MKAFLLLISSLFSIVVYSQCNTIYVTPTGIGDGSELSPTYLANALVIASPGDHIKLSTGVHNINTISSIPNNIIIEGGYIDWDNWTKTSIVNGTVIRRGASGIVNTGTPTARISAFELNGVNGFRFQDLTIRVVDAPVSSDYGISVYGIYLNNCSNYQIVRCEIEVGDASKGANGANGTDGFPGNDGSLGWKGKPNDKIRVDGGRGGSGLGSPGGIGGYGSPSEVPGGVGSPSSNSHTPRFGSGGSGGGGGGNSDNNGGNGGLVGNVPGVPGCYGTLTLTTISNAGVEDGCNPLAATSCVAGISGETGVDGSDGADGCDGGLGASGVKNVFWESGVQANSGIDGQGGTGGQGGGGGAGEGGVTCFNGTGSGGSGGGGGGMGGQGGFGGFGGGSSYAIYIYDNGSLGVIDDCNLIVGLLGQGGTGGDGGLGALGGDGNVVQPPDGTFEVGCGGAGGNGGKGGTGGKGGKGSLGESMVIYVNGTALTSQVTNFNLAGQNEIKVENKNCNNEIITFSNTGFGLWNFGAGSSPSSGYGVTVNTIYSNSGRKDITLAGDTYKGFAYITNLAPSEANAGKDSTTCGFMILYATNPIKGIGKWTPITPGTSVFDTLANNTAVGLVPGINKLEWSVSYGACCPPSRDTITIIKETASSPATSIVASSDTVCEGTSVNLTATGGVLGDGAQWKWYIDSCNGTLIDSGISISVLLTDSMTYYVRAEGNCNITSCIAKTIIVPNTPLAQDSIISYRDTFCIVTGDSLTLIASGVAPESPYRRAWYKNDCEGTFLGYGDSIKVHPTSATIYFLKVEGLCDTTTCVSKIILTANPSVVSTNIVTTEDSICQGESIVLKQVGGILGTNANWVWYTQSCGDSLLYSSNIDSIIITPSQTQNYYVKAEGYCNTTLCESINIHLDSVSTSPDSITASNNSICFGDSVVLSVSGGTLRGGDSWNWYQSFCGGSAIAVGSSTTINPSYTNTYFVKAEGGNCYSADCSDKLISVLSPPVYLLPFDTLCLYDESILLNNGSPGGGSYIGTGLTGNVFTPYSAGIGNHLISYNYTDLSSGCSVILSDYINIKENCINYASLVKVNTFSPNGDGVNDTWNLNLGSIPNSKLTVFNKWGNIVFVSKEHTINWDGTYLGSPLPSGSYFYVLSLNDYTLKGDITIVR